MYTIRLKTKSGTIRELPVVDIEREPRPCLIIRWGFANYHLDLLRNEFVYIQGNRIARRYQWKAESIETAKDIYQEILQNILKNTLTPQKKPDSL